MKRLTCFAMLAAMTLTATISFAQTRENSNPYAIFGGEPRIIGEQYDQNSVFVVDNFAEGSPVARIEHNPRTGQVRFFDAKGSIVDNIQLGPRDYGWGVPDPKAEKYYSISPYAYCANNPVRYIDPDGQEIWLYYDDEDGNEQKLLYTANMKYEGSNSFVGNMIGNLNAVYGNGGGNMLDALIGSSNAFNVLNQAPTIAGAGGTFRRNMDADGNPLGGGTIYAGVMGSEVNFTNVESTAHEFMHGAQHEFGQGGASVWNEVEAYVFGFGVASNYGKATGNYGGSSTPMGIGGTPASDVWESSFNSLLKNGYSGSAMANAVNNFQAGAQVNAGGQYNRYGGLPTPYVNGVRVKSILGGFWKPKP